MPPDLATVLSSRRAFLTRAGSGLGAAALAAVLKDEARGALPAPTSGVIHHPPRAKNCIFIFLAGGTSQIELFDPKPSLHRSQGERLPDSFTKNVRLGFTKPQESKLMASRFAYRRYGECGMEMSELLPHIGSMADDITLVRSMYTEEFDHAPAEIFFSTGFDQPGRPSAGSWLTYGLGSESRSLPAYVVLMTGRGPVSRSLAWGNGFLPPTSSGVLFRNTGEPILNLGSPPGLSRVAQRAELDAVRDLNRARYEQIRDPRIQDRIEAYELAFRMQIAAPELIDTTAENLHTHEAYGTDRGGVEPASFANNCLLARRLVERGVRFVSIFHRRWDHHGGLQGGLEDTCHTVDQPIGALLRDLKERGLLDDTLVVWGTEFGRTPVTQNTAPGPSAGRDHHRFAFSLWMAGGGVGRGRVVGATDEFGWHAVENRVSVHDFHATLLHLFGIDHLELTHRFGGLDVRLTDQSGDVVQEILA